MNPLTKQPWALSDAARGEIRDILRRDRYARRTDTGFLVMQIDAAAADYRRRLALWQEIKDAHGLSYNHVRSLGRAGSTFAKHALALDDVLRRGGGRPPSTREKPALVFALARLWHNEATFSLRSPFSRSSGPKLSPRSTFVRILDIVLADCGTPTKSPYKLAERINKKGIPPVFRVEPTTLESFPFNSDGTSRH